MSLNIEKLVVIGPSDIVAKLREAANSRLAPLKRAASNQADLAPPLKKVHEDVVDELALLRAENEALRKALAEAEERYSHIRFVIINASEYNRKAVVLYLNLLVPCRIRATDAENAAIRKSLLEQTLLTQPLPHTFKTY